MVPCRSATIQSALILAVCYFKYTYSGMITASLSETRWKMNVSTGRKKGGKVWDTTYSAGPDTRVRRRSIDWAGTHSTYGMV